MNSNFSIPVGLESDIARKNSGQVIFEQFQALMTTTGVDDQPMKQIRELEKDSEGVAKLEILRHVNGLFFFAEVSTCDTYR